MTFQQLIYVVTVAEERSFSKAAQRLYISQPSLSQYIINLEKNLDVLLFDRTCNPIKLTEAGEEFIETAQQILRLKDELDKKMERASVKEYESLTVGVSPFRTSIYMPYVIAAFKAKYPNIKINIVEGYMKELEKSDIELIINTLPVNESIYDYQYIGNEKILLAVPPEFEINKVIDARSSQYEIIGGKQLKKVKLKDLKNEPFIILKSGKRMHELSMRLCRNSGFSPKVVMENDNLDSALSMVLAGLGVTFIPDTVVKYGNMANHPVYYCIDDQDEVRQAVIAYRKDKKLSKAAEEFIKVIQEVLS